MSTEPWLEFVRLLGSALAVAACVVPITIALAWRTRHRREPVLPRVKPWPVPWNGLDLTLTMILVVLVPLMTSEFLNRTPWYAWLYGPEFVALTEPGMPGESIQAGAAGFAAVQNTQHAVDSARTLKGLWAGVLAFPLQLLLLSILTKSLSGGSLLVPPRWHAVPARLILAGRAWLLLTPLVFAVHFVMLLLSAWLGVAPEEHPLTQFGAGRSLGDALLFVLQACVVAPVIEETLCRGLLLPWAARRTYRPWLVLAAALPLAALMTSTADNLVQRHGGTLFFLGLAAMWAIMNARPRSVRQAVVWRRWGGVFASAVLFAALHSSVWPTPVPLFVLGLGLGMLALATRGVLVPIVVHGLFNAVSVVFVLAGK